MKNMSITIDILSKLRKIYDGKVFSDRLVVITELFQNCQRAGAKNVYIQLDNGMLTFKDDGCGCKTPTDILTLDHSNWETTDEGFGIGLWSWLAVRSVEGIEIKSDKWKMTLNIKDIFEEHNLKAKVENLNEKIKGFEVIIYSHTFTKFNEVVYNRIISDAETQSFNVYLNGNIIPKKDLHQEIKEKKFSKTFSNRLFKATLAPAKWGYIDSYYERRKVDNFYITDYLDGVIEINKNALTLQEPDRKNVIRDEKRNAFIDKVEECRKEVYLDIVKSSDNKTIDEYAEQINMVLDVKDYERYILVDDLILETEESTRNVSEISYKVHSFKRLLNLIQDINKTTQLSFTDNENEKQEEIEKLLNLHSHSNIRWVKTDEADADGLYEMNEAITEDLLKNISAISIGGTVYKKINIEDHKDCFEDDDEEIISNITVKTTKKKKKKESLKTVLRNTNRKVWVKASEVEEYQDLISKVEYYGVKVFIARNVLHENIFRTNNIPYITAIEKGIRKRNIKWDIYLKTKKEKRFIELLLPICKYYNLPLNTFKIGNLKLIIETVLDGKVINREVVENKKNSIKIYGTTDGENIILDRRAIGLNRFNLTGNSLGIHELKAIMANIRTIAHELAHLIYKTEDNTKDHTEKENLIYDEIVNIYLSL